MYVRTALLATAVSLAFVATPVFAQTFNGYDNQDPAVTRGYAPFEGAGTAGAPVMATAFPWSDL